VSSFSADPAQPERDATARSRAAQGSVQLLETEPVDLTERLRSIAEHQDAVSAAHRVIASVPGEPLLVDANLPKLERALDNLLLNAIKYSPHGGIVTLSAEGHGDEVWISVTDQGIGIPAADLPRIFDRFHRGANVSGRTSGIGLGLASVARAIDAHGGTIEASSVEGEGSTFTIHLPRRRAGVDR